MGELKRSEAKHDKHDPVAQRTSGSSTSTSRSAHASDQSQPSASHNTFSPKLTAAITATATALQKDDASFRFQRKLMAGGACEATVFCEYGLDATCVCLPLGNYHNMGDLATVEQDSPDRASVARETISIDDYRQLVQLLVACATKLDDAPPVRAHIDARYDSLAWVIGMGEGAFTPASS